MPVTPASGYRVDVMPDQSTLESHMGDTLCPDQKKRKLYNCIAIRHFSDLTPTLTGGSFENCTCQVRLKTSTHCFKRYPGLIEWSGKNVATSDPILRHFIVVMDPKPKDEDGNEAAPCIIATQKDARDQKGNLLGCNELLLTNHGSPNDVSVYHEVKTAHDDLVHRCDSSAFHLTIFIEDLDVPEVCVGCFGKRKLEVTERRRVTFEIGPSDSESANT
jgi:hypothetical protein